MSKSMEALAELLEERARAGVDVSDVDRRIRSLFGETWCVVFTDMVGFSRRAREDGIIPFLALIHQLDKVALPIIQRNAGFVLKRIADSYMVIFRDPQAALRACVDLERALERHNRAAGEDQRIYVGCGIGYGPCLKLGDDDIFGVEVNHAAKLGEDTAVGYEILLTPAAMAAAGAAVEGVTFEEVAGEHRKGGPRFVYYRAVYGIPSFTPPSRSDEPPRVLDPDVARACEPTQRVPGARVARERKTAKPKKKLKRS